MDDGRLVGAALARGAGDVPGWSVAEAQLVGRVDPVAPDAETLELVRAVVQAGGDPLGEAFAALRSPEARRPLGATYTRPIVASMVEWAADQSAPARIVDPGSGSGRFALAAGRRFPGASLVAVELVNPRARTSGTMAATMTVSQVSSQVWWSPGCASGHFQTAREPRMVARFGGRWRLVALRGRSLPCRRSWVRVPSSALKHLQRWLFSSHI